MSDDLDWTEIRQLVNRLAAEVAKASGRSRALANTVWKGEIDTKTIAEVSSHLFTCSSLIEQIEEKAAEMRPVTPRAN